ncbi:putative Sialic acid TRAP transporter permease protein SiaT [uncultured Desulfatiglans sp.]|uniref:Putative Sialic acid TRAP transporter permease protein SiaT n=1 Tax=Uncultured Desulfatiglans sp. TaxID=1748965 RepID=A0A653A3N3_UNCDX|nr:putative Sialic acid TRAP transporter permease protein SiaT [uncultured Desulfatiglans sp.]
METLIILAILLFLLFIRIPVYISLFLTGLLGLLIFTDLELIFVAQTMVKKLDNFSLLAIPFFILLGAVMVHGQSANRMIHLARKSVSFMPGGLAVTGVISSGVFGAISGSSISTLVTIGSVLFPHLDKYKYPKSFSIGLLTSSAILGIIVPPSIIMIICALTAGQSVVRLFAAGYLPSFLIVAGLCFYAYVVSAWKGLGKTAMEPFDGRGLMKAFKDAFFPFMVIVVLFAGIYTGAFTITEASVVSCVMAILIEAFIYRTLSPGTFYKMLVSSGIISGALVITVSGAGVLAEYITIQGIPQRILDVSLQYIPNVWVFLIFTNLLLLLVGTFLDPIGAIMILVPILMPISDSFGIDPIHLCLVISVALGIGYITPPLGLLLYTASAITKTDFVFVSRAIMPTLLVYIALLFLISFFPALSTAVPNLLLGKV